MPIMHGHSSINSYHMGFRNGVSFDKTDKTRRYMGVEIEINSVPSRSTSASYLYAKINTDFEYITIERDGSVTGGFEVITQPLNTDKLFEIGDIVFNKLKEMSPFSATNAGLHVHVPRYPYEWFSEFTDDQMEVIRIYGRNLSYLILNNKYREDLKAYSRRSDYHYCPFPPDGTLTAPGDHFAAIGRRSETFEIRIFRGTTRFDIYKSTILFVEKLVTLAVKYAKKKIDLVYQNNPMLLPDFTVLLDDVGRRFIRQR